MIARTRLIWRTTGGVKADPVITCYATGMATQIRIGIARWIFENLLWDASGTLQRGFRGGLWATRKLLIAIAGAALLTWVEWVKHHPPEIALVAIIHFVFVLAAIAVAVQAGRWLRRSGRKSSE